MNQWNVEKTLHSSAVRRYNFKRNILMQPQYKS
jgi:hypothetical protein